MLVWRLGSARKIPMRNGQNCQGWATDAIQERISGMPQCFPVRVAEMAMHKKGPLRQS